MKTNHWIVDKVEDKFLNYPQIEQPALLLKNNEAVAFPTETVYGLGANAICDEAVAKIFAAKGRPADNPLIIHISSIEQLQKLVEEIPANAQKLMEAFWPGPLTIIFRKKEGIVSELVTAGLQTIAVRMPDHPIALALIAKADLPIAAPSANRSGKPSPTTAAHVLADLDGRISGVVDGGKTGVGVESTVVDCTGATPVILRPGGITKEEVEMVVGHVEEDPALVDVKAKPKSPGMKYTHYAPAAPLYLIDGDQKWIQEQINEKRRHGLKVGVLTTVESASLYDADIVLSCGSRSELNTVASNLYETLRAFDETEVDFIFSETFPEKGVGSAIMNRLQKAAGEKWIRKES